MLFRNDGGRQSASRLQLFDRHLGQFQAFRRYRADAGLRSAAGCAARPLRRGKEG